jgi:hypothetical protein
MEIPKRNPPPTLPKRTISSAQIAKPQTAATQKKQFSVSTIKPERKNNMKKIIDELKMAQEGMKRFAPCGSILKSVRQHIKLALKLAKKRSK